MTLLEVLAAALLLLGSAAILRAVVSADLSDEAAPASRVPQPAAEDLRRAA